MVSSPPIELAIFDLAGTTIADHNEVHQAFLSALRQNDIEVDPREIHAQLGSSKNETIRKLVIQAYGPDDKYNEERIHRAYQNFQEILEKIYMEQGVRPIDGVEETFHWLKARNIKIAATTAFYRKLTTIILKKLDWHEGMLDTKVCSDDVIQGRPAPYMIFKAMEQTGVRSVHRVIKIGNTPVDLLAGINAGIRAVIGVLSGVHTVESLGAVKHSYLIPSVADLPKLLEKEFYQEFY